MEASKEGEMPGEPSPEELPAETGEETPKKSRMVLAIVVVVILVIAALAAAWGLGLFGGKEDENLPPTAGARATTPSSIAIGGSVTLESTATDSDGTIADYAWYFGDGTSQNGSTLDEVTHTYQYGGSYYVYLVVTDDEGATANNEASMVRITVWLYLPPTEEDMWDNDTAPLAILVPDNDVIDVNDTVTFNMTGCLGFAWQPDDSFASSWENITSIVLDFGDGTNTTVTPAEYLSATHKYTAAGHYAAKLTVTGENGKATSVISTIHALLAAVTPPGSIKNPDAFVEVTIGEPQYLDPAVDYETAGGEVIMNAYETLVWYDRESSSELIPLLATAVPTVANGGISADGLNYTFTLKQGVKFHDNVTVMDQDDVEYSIERVLRIHDDTGPSWMLEQIMNDYIQYYVDGPLADFKADSFGAQWVYDAIGGTADDYIITQQDVQNVSEAAVVKVDTDKIMVKLTHPYPGFLAIAAFSVMCIVNMEFVEAHGGVVNTEHNAYMDENVFGTGPYKLVSWEKGSRIHMTRFDGYHGALPALKDAYIIKANDVNTRILMLQAGDADTGFVPIEYESLFANDDDFEITKGLPTFNIDFIGFNQNINTTEASVWGSTVPANFFADKNVRKAFTHMVNIPLFITNYMKGNAIQPNGPIPAGMFGYNASKPVYEYNLTRAMEYLQNATNPGTGNSWWEDGFKVALIFNAGNMYRETGAQYLKQGLTELNDMPGTHGTFEATINSLDWPTYLTTSQKKPSPLPVFFLGWAPDYADPDDYVNPFVYSKGTYPLRMAYANASIDLLAEQAAAELDTDTRADLYGQLTDLVFDDCPLLWLAQANNFHIERAWLTGYYMNPMYYGYYFAAFDKA